MYGWAVDIYRECVRNPGYRDYLRFKLLRSIGCEVGSTADILVNPSLPSPMAASIARQVARLHRRPTDYLENPFEFLGTRIKYLDEQQFRYSIEEIFVDGCYWFSSNRADPVIIDCGSNIGVSILFFKALYPQATVIGFEPDPTTFGVLVENMHENKHLNVELHNVALCDRDTNIDFYTSPERRGLLTMSACPERLPGLAITVPGKPLSPFIGERVDLMKMDIEGSEDVVMAELETSGALQRISRIHLEYHHHIDQIRDVMSGILALLERNGFGYQIRAACPGWPEPGVFEDVAIFAYQKSLLFE